MHYSFLKQMFQPEKSEQEKLEFLHLTMQNSKGVSIDDFIVLTPRSCQNFITEKILTHSQSYFKFTEHFIKEDSEGEKVYLLEKENCLFDQNKYGNISYLNSKGNFQIILAYDFLIKKQVLIANPESFNKTLNQLIIYEKKHEIISQNPLHQQLYRVSNMELILREKSKKLLFTFLQNQNEFQELLETGKFYQTEKIEFSNYGSDEFKNELSEFLVKFHNTLNINYQPIFQLLKLIIGCRIVYQLNMHKLKPCLKFICQSFSKQLFDHFLFIFTKFHQIMIKFIKDEFENLANGILAESINSLSITITAYQQFYKVSSKIVNYDYRKNISIPNFLDYYYRFDLLYLQFNQVTQIEEFALIVDHYRLKQKSEFPNVLVQIMLLAISTKIQSSKNLKVIDPFEQISFDTPSSKLISSYQTFFLDRHLYLSGYEWQLFLYDTFNQIRGNKAQLENKQFINTTIEYVNHNYEGLKQVNLVQQLLVNLLPTLQNKYIMFIFSALSDYILLVLTILDPKPQLFIKLFAIIIYKYYQNGQLTNMDLLESTIQKYLDLQSYLCRPDYNYLIIGTIKLINNWKNSISNSKDLFYKALNLVKWDYKSIGLAFFRCGSYIDAVYYLELYLSKNNLIWSLDRKELNHNKQEELYNILMYINNAREHLNCAVCSDHIYEEMQFEFNLQFNDDKDWYIHQQIEWKLFQKQIPLDIKLYNFQENINKKQHLNILEPKEIEKAAIQLIADISKYCSKKLTSDQVDSYLNYIKMSVSLSIKSISLSTIFSNNLSEVSQIIQRLESYWEGIKGADKYISFNAKFPQNYWLYLNSIVKLMNKNCKIIQYKREFAKYLIQNCKYQEAFKVCKKKSVQCKIYEKLGQNQQAINMIGVDPIQYIQNKGNFITDSQQCKQKLKFLRNLIADSVFYRERVLSTYNEIWNSKSNPTISPYFEKKKRLQQFSFHYATELEKDYKYQCDCSTLGTCLKLMDIFLTCIASGDKYVLQSFPKVFRIWYNHQNKESFPVKFESYLSSITADKLQYSLELLITGVETFKNDKSSSRTISIALSNLADNYPSQMIWWLAPLKYFNQISPHKVTMYQNVLKLTKKSKSKIEELEKQLNLILMICQQKSRNVQSKGWVIENISSQLLGEYLKNSEKLIYPGIENLAQPFKREEQLIKIIQIYPQMKIAPSKDKPKKIQLECSDTTIRYLLLKNEVEDKKNSGDTRREQRIIYMLQLFNSILEPLQLKYPIFASMSLSQMNQAIEWLTQTKTCREVIDGKTIQAKNGSVYNQSEWEVLIADKPKLTQYFFSQYPDPYQWFDAQQRYIKSMALWSAFQYLIGFGDRHCDNILIHENGELIHIDYECVFHKGKFLPVPEIVDFRLTDNFRYALGYLRDQGQFKQLLENILNLFLKNKEAIIAFLDPYIYDPLLCKTSSNVTELIQQKLNANQKVNDLIKRNTDKTLLRMMYFGWAPHL